MDIRKYFGGGSSAKPAANGSTVNAHRQGNVITTLKKIKNKKLVMLKFLSKVELIQLYSSKCCHLKKIV